MAVWGEQFSSGNQGTSKEAFWRSGFKKCQQCGGEQIKRVEHGAGCRMNGDGYGTTVFSCSDCDWNTSFQWDEAGETYYYETEKWKHKPKIAPAPQELTDEIIAKFERMKKNMPLEALQQAMLRDGVSQENITRLLQEYPYVEPKKCCCVVL